MVIGITSENDEFYDGLASKLMEMGYQVMNPVSAPGFKNAEIHHQNAVHRCGLCQALVLNPEDPYEINQEVINHAVLNNQIIVLDGMSNVEETLTHIKKEITNA